MGRQQIRRCAAFVNWPWGRLSMRPAVRARGVGALGRLLLLLAMLTTKSGQSCAQRRSAGAELTAWPTTEAWSLRVVTDTVIAVDFALYRRCTANAAMCAQQDRHHCYHYRHHPPHRHCRHPRVSRRGQSPQRRPFSGCPCTPSLQVAADVEW